MTHCIMLGAALTLGVALSLVLMFICSELLGITSAQDTLKPGYNFMGTNKLNVEFLL